MPSRSLTLAVTSTAALALSLHAQVALATTNPAATNLAATREDVPPGAAAGTAGPAEGQADVTRGNHGTVWLSETTDAGRGNDPHLGCGPIVVRADKMAEASGTYAVSLHPPTGDGGVVTGGRWEYPAAGPLPIAGFSGAELVQGASRLGAAPQSQQGYHFKLDVSQDGHDKHKVFWVDCPVQVAVQPSAAPAVATAPAEPVADVSSETLTDGSTGPAPATLSAALEEPSVAGGVVEAAADGAQTEDRGTGPAQVMGVGLVGAQGLPLTGGPWVLLAGVGAALVGLGVGVLRLRRAASE